MATGAGDAGAVEDAEEDNAAAEDEVVRVRWGRMLTHPVVSAATVGLSLGCWRDSDGRALLQTGLGHDLELVRLELVQLGAAHGTPHGLRMCRRAKPDTPARRSCRSIFTRRWASI